MSGLAGVVSAVFWGALLLSALVFVHEGGHYVAARAFGMRVTEFFLGLPCRWRLSHKSADHGTEVGVTPILLGGYNRICGMDGAPTSKTAPVLAAVARHGRVPIEQLASELSMASDDVYAELSLLVDWASVEPFYDEEMGERPGQSAWPRSVQTVERDADLLTAFDSGHDFSLEGSTKAGEPHRIPEDDAEAFVESEKSRTYQGKGFVARIVTLLAGPAINVILGIALIAGVFSIGGITVARDVPIVGEVTEGSLAAQAGVQEGDEITSVNGSVVSTWTDMGQDLRDAISGGTPFDVTLERSGVELVVRVDPSADSGDGKFGIVASTEVYHPTVAQSLSIGWNYLTQTVSYVAQLFQPAHTAEVVSQSTSVVGISVMASQAAASGAQSFLYLMAAISLSLGIMNLIPIPPLDGGKLIIELVQLVIRRDVPTRVQTYLSYAGIALALVLFFAVLHQDIARFVLGD